MKRYINVADLYEILNEMDMLETYNDFKAVQWAINNTPTADVTEVKHGQWLRVEYLSKFKCSECGQGTYFSGDKFCSNCGAQMDGENNDL